MDLIAPDDFTAHGLQRLYTLLCDLEDDGWTLDSVSLGAGFVWVRLSCAGTRNRDAFTAHGRMVTACVTASVNLRCSVHCGCGEHMDSRGDFYFLSQPL